MLDKACDTTLERGSARVRATLTLSDSQEIGSKPEIGSKVRVDPKLAFEVESYNTPIIMLQ